MSEWLATTRHAVSSPRELEQFLILHEGDKRNKRVKAQYEAAIKAATDLMSTFDGEVNVAASGSDGHVELHVAKP